MINNLLTIGKSALNNFQIGLSVTGGNIANASTQGYARRVVNYATDGDTASFTGVGASVESIVRKFDAFLERRYLEQTASSSRESTLDSYLSQVEALFNDTEDSGVTTQLDTFMSALSGLSSNPSDTATRTELLGAATSLAEQINTIASSLSTQSQSVEASIADQVDTVNALLKQIASINGKISSASESSGLLDQRDELLRELATYVDISATVQSDGQVRVTTSEGQNLVDGFDTYSLQVQGPKSTAALTTTSGFDGQLYFEGSSTNELTVKFATGGDTSGTSTAATFNVSLDGGKTWITDEDGNVRSFTAGGADHKAVVDGVSIWFGTKADQNTAPGTNISAGDTFDVMPKSGLYWITSTGGAVNVTPLAGNANANRLSGGSIAGLYSLRDEYIGEYQDRLDALSESLAWNVNRIHSQGAGLTNLSQVNGEYAVANASEPLAQSGLHWQDQLTAGNLSISLYNASTGSLVSTTALDFSSVTPGASSFDPSVHSLEDVKNALNATYSGQLTASVTDGKLSIQAADGVSFQFAEDTSGLLAGLGINTFFSGTDAASLAVSDVVANDTSRICAGHVNGAGEVNASDNQTAAALAALSSQSVSFFAAHGVGSGTLGSYLNGLVAKVGEDSAAAKTSAAYASTLAEDIGNQRESVSGVNMDEELTRLMQYQQGYQAAAKLIQTASELFETILALK